MTASATQPTRSAHWFHSNRQISRLAFGGAPIGNLYTEVETATAYAAVEHAWERGIRHFDTAPYYGYGLSETRLSGALLGKPRSSYTLSTKVGRWIETDSNALDHPDGFFVDGFRAHFDYSRDAIFRSFEASLKRLCTHRVEILLLHDVGSDAHGENHQTMLRQALDEALPAMAELRAQGACDAIGIGVNEEAVCLELMPRFPLDVIMLAGRYTLFEQHASRRVMAEAESRGISILAAGPYNSGLLGDAAGPGRFYNYSPAAPDVLERAQRFYSVCAETGTDIGAAALQFPLAHPAVATVVCGLRSSDEVITAANRFDTVVPDETWDALRKAGLLEADVLTP
ncbi:aldo/keto reductase [Dyella sp. A6]|uniref:aldo/keto reductase n=1 Tax=Dyella aluminiiresistens TaxID=3069105 RepID=UPI002E791651|nr:aldo/keto reductase [Dyella sp. A6]